MIDQIHPLFGVEEVNAVSDYMLSGAWLTEHKETELFEKKICEFLKVDYCIAVPNGTIALMLALDAHGIDGDSIVIVPALTMVATANSAMYLGAEVKACDVNDHGCMDYNCLENIIDDDISAVVHVSLNGRSKDIEKIASICEDRDIPLIEDACQSLGSKNNSMYLGTIGDVGCFSLSPQKIISTGQGGLIVTNNKEIYDRIKIIKDFGRIAPGSNYHDEYGINAKYTDLQAVIGLEQLRKLPYRIDRKKEIYNLYRKHLGEMVIENNEEVVPWMVDIISSKRNLIRAKLISKGIGTRLNYLTLDKHKYLNTLDSFFEANYLSNNILWLPSSIDLTNKEIEEICREILRCPGI